MLNAGKLLIWHYQPGWQLRLKHDLLFDVRRKFDPGDKVTFVKNEPCCHPCLEKLQESTGVLHDRPGEGDKGLVVETKSTAPPMTSSPARPVQSDYNDTSPIDSPATDKSEFCVWLVFGLVFEVNYIYCL